MGAIPDEWPVIDERKFAEWDEDLYSDFDTEFEEEINKVTTEGSSAHDIACEEMRQRLIKKHPKVFTDELNGNTMKMEPVSKIQTGVSETQGGLHRQGAASTLAPCRQEAHRRPTKGLGYSRGGRCDRVLLESEVPPQGQQRGPQAHHGLQGDQRYVTSPSLSVREYKDNY